MRLASGHSGEGSEKATSSAGAVTPRSLLQAARTQRLIVFAVQVAELVEQRLANLELELVLRRDGAREVLAIKHDRSRLVGHARRRQLPQRQAAIKAQDGRRQRRIFCRQIL